MRTQEAARIIRRLDEYPEDRSALRDRDLFLSRGQKEQATYDRTLHAMGHAEIGLHRNRNKRYVFVLFAAIIAPLALAAEPIRLSFLADFQSGRRVVDVGLASGDRVKLDAGSAIDDQTDVRERRVTLLTGAGYFDAGTSVNSFVIGVGDAAIETLGTAFEVSSNGTSTQVSVIEGALRVTQAGHKITEDAGERVRWQDRLGATTQSVGTVAIAGWRHNLLRADGMIVDQVTEIIDRRIKGTILVLRGELANTVVYGRFDFSRPANAFRTLAASVDANVYMTSPFGALLSPQ